jgi:hypothetical protein
MFCTGKAIAKADAVSTRVTLQVKKPTGVVIKPQDEAAEKKVFLHFEFFTSFNILSHFLFIEMPYLSILERRVAVLILLRQPHQRKSRLCSWMMKRLVTSMSINDILLVFPSFHL